MTQADSKLVAGTSGFSYKSWKGPFYPEKLAASKMLGYYSRKLNGVEINNTFYRLPRREMLEKWAAQVPRDFSFVLKASRQITHFRRLKGAQEVLAYLLDTASAGLGDRLGTVFFQLPPNFKKDVERLAGFLALLPESARAAFEFRHESWFSSDVYDALTEHGAALVIADAGEDPPPVLATSPVFGYARLRRPAYGKAEVDEWARKLRDLGWDRTFVFFKHEDDGAGPELAQRFRDSWEQSG